MRTQAKPESLPLSTPDGEVLTWACGLCRRVRCGAESWGPPDAEKRTSLAEFYRKGADSCCVCQTCGKVEAGIVNDCNPCRQAAQEKWEEESPARIAKQEAEDAESDATFARSPDPTAARDLMQRMSDLSEDCYCAGWLIGCEYTLWHFVLTGPGDWGQSRVAREDIDAMRALSEKCGGWVAWRDDIGNVFVPLAEWLSMYTAETERAKAWLAQYEANKAAQSDA